MNLSAKELINFLLQNLCREKTSKASRLQPRIKIQAANEWIVSLKNSDGMYKIYTFFWKKKKKKYLQVLMCSFFQPLSSFKKKKQMGENRINLLTDWREGQSITYTVYFNDMLLDLFHHKYLQCRCLTLVYGLRELTASVVPVLL